MDWGDSMGGGFMNDSVAEEPQQLTSSVSLGGDDKNKSVTCVSIAQIVKFTRPNEGLVLYGKKVYHLNLVALIYEVLDINPQKIHLLLDDYTSGGPLEVTHIIGDIGTPGADPSLSMFQENIPGENEQSKRLCDLKVGDYVRCIGVVKYNQDKANLVAYNMTYVDDPNDVTMHTLEVIRDAMLFERLQQGNVGLPAPVNVTSGVTTTGISNYQQPTSINQQPQQHNAAFGKLSTRDKYLLQFLREKGMEAGTSMEDMAKNFKGIPRREIEESLSTLAAEGLAWQGDSEDLWCVNATD